MHRLYPSVALVLALAAGCSGPEDRHLGPADEVADLYCQQTQLDWVASTTSGRSLTEARVDSLNDYAAAALRARQCGIDRTLARRDALTEDRPNIADLYTIEVGNEATCLNGSYWWVDFDIANDDRYHGMKEQIDRAVEFLARFHEDTGGVPTVIFDQVMICPKKGAFEEELLLTGPTLYINVPYDLFTGNGLTTFDARELREKWSTGEHLANMPMADLLEVLWPLFDPAGTTRFALRSGLAARALDLVGRLVDVGGKLAGRSLVDLAAIRGSLQTILRDSVSDTLTTADGDLLVDTLGSRLAAADEAQLSCVTQAWKDYLADPERWTAASEAAVATMYREAARNSLSVNVEQNGFVVVGNTHFVNVNLDVFLSSGYKDLERYVEVVEVPQDIQWTQNGFVVVYTVDDIDVNVSVSSEKSLATAGVERALGQCGL